MLYMSIVYIMCIYIYIFIFIIYMYHVPFVYIYEVPVKSYHVISQGTCLDIMCPWSNMDGPWDPGSFTTSSYGYRCAFRDFASCGDGGAPNQIKVSVENLFPEKS